MIYLVVVTLWTGGKDHIPRLPRHAPTLLRRGSAHALVRHHLNGCLRHPASIPVDGYRQDYWGHCLPGRGSRGLLESQGLVLPHVHGGNATVQVGVTHCCW